MRRGNIESKEADEKLKPNKILICPNLGVIQSSAAAGPYSVSSSLSSPLSSSLSCPLVLPCHPPARKRPSTPTPRGRGTKAMRRGIVPALAPWLRRPNHLRFTESRHKRSPQFSDRGLHPLVKKSPHPLTRLAFTPCRLHSLSSSLSVVRDASVAQNVLKLLPQKVRVGGVIVRYWWPHRRIVSPAAVGPVHWIAAHQPPRRQHHAFRGSKLADGVH